MPTRYRSRGGRSTTTAVARWLDLRYPATCVRCNTPLPVGTRAWWDPRSRTACCTELECAAKHGLTEEKWHGSPVSGKYVTVLAGRRLGGDPLPATGVTTFRTSSGWTGTRNARGRCEDAPCCGCCTF